MPINMSSHLTPASQAIPFILEDKYIRGGYRTVATYGELAAIPLAARRAGMLVCDSSTGILYTLEAGNVTTWIEKEFISFQENLMDTSEEVALQPGSFGYGGEAIEITDSLNNYNTFSCVVQGINLPDAPTTDRVVVEVSAGSGIAIQKCDSATTSWTRVFNSTWGAWLEGVTASSVNDALALKANTSDVNDALALKANTADVTNQLATKANTTDVTNQLATKANVSDVNSQLSQKANISYVDNALASKVNVSDYNSDMSNKVDVSVYNAGIASKVDTTTFNSAIAASAYGIKYSWANEAARNAQTGMVALQQGVQQDNRTVYSYNGSSWQVFYTLDGVHNHDADYLPLAGGTLTGPLITDHPIRTTLQGHSFHSGITDLVRLNLHGAGNEFLGAVLADDTGIGLVNKTGINTFRVEGDNAILAGDLDATSAHLDSLVMSGTISRTSTNGTARWLQQDGDGRQHWYWNTEGGIAPTYERGAEGALDLMMHTDVGHPETLKFRTASGTGKNAGDPIVWEDTLLADNAGNFKYRGADVATAANPGGLRYNGVVQINANTTIAYDGSSTSKIYSLNGTSPITVTLPSASSVPPGQGYTFFDNMDTVPTAALKTVSSVNGEIIYIWSSSRPDSTTVPIYASKTFIMSLGDAWIAMIQDIRPNYWEPTWATPKGWNWVDGPGLNASAASEVYFGINAVRDDGLYGMQLGGRGNNIIARTVNNGVLSNSKMLYHNENQINLGLSQDSARSALGIAQGNYYKYLSAITAASTLDLTYLGTLVACNAPSNYTVTLPSAITAGSGRSISFFHNGTANTVTLSAIAGQTILSTWPDTGAQTYPLRLGQKLTVVSDGANWYIANNYIGATSSPVSGSAMLRDSTGKAYATDFIIGSDRKLKSEIEVLKDSLQTLLQWEGVSYVLNSSGEYTTGFIAQQLEESVPHLVTENSEHKSVAYLQMLPYIVESIKTIHKRLTSLEERYASN